MHGETLSIQFDLPATDALGRIIIDGKLRCVEDKVIIQFKVRQRTFGSAGEGLQTIEFPYSEVEHIKFVNGWFKKRLVLKTCDPALLESMPGSDLGCVEMHVDKESRLNAAKIESFIDFKQSMALAEESRERWERSRGDREEIESTDGVE